MRTKRYKEFKIVAYYDETQEHRIVAGTKGDHIEAGVVMRRLAARIQLDQADEKIGNVDGFAVDSQSDGASKSAAGRDRPGFLPSG